MKSKHLSLLFVTLVVILLSACNEKNLPDSNDPINQESNQPDPNGNGGNNSSSSSITCDPTSKTVSADGDSFVVTIKSNVAWSASTNQSWVTIEPKTGQGDAFVTIAIAAGDAGTAQVLFSNGENTATLTIERGSSPIPPTPSLPEGMLPGEFSVSATTKVHFSKGNLRYFYSEEWKFAEHQYDGYPDSNGGTCLFGWGTGNSPWRTSTDNNDYSTFTDWGINAISNGGNQPSFWRTLTGNEWQYLLKKRSDATSLFGFSKVNDTKGLILLPDNWKTPSGASFYPGELDFSYNIYTIEQWTIMESAGAVFLPADGLLFNREHSEAGGEGKWYCGYYWSASEYDYRYADCLEFGSHGATTGSQLRVCGFSVRLVR